MLRKTPLKRGTSQLKRSGFKQKSLEEVKALSAIKKPKKRLQGLGPSAKQKKPSVAKLKKKADVVWSQYIRLRDSDRNGMVKCISCDTVKHWKEMQNGHFVTRGVNSLRYDEQNCNGQCVACNMFKSGNLFEYGRQLDLKYGDGTAEALHARRFETHKLKIDELEDIIRYAQDYINENT